MNRRDWKHTGNCPYEKAIVFVRGIIDSCKWSTLLIAFPCSNSSLEVSRNNNSVFIKPIHRSFWWEGKDDRYPCNGLRNVWSRWPLLQDKICSFWWQNDWMRWLQRTTSKKEWRESDWPSQRQRWQPPSRRKIRICGVVMTKNTMMMKRIQIVEEAVQTSVCFWKNVERMQTVWKVCIAQEISVLTAVSLG